MSIDPAIFRALVAQGATPEMLLAVVEADAAVREEKLAKKRAGGAERQQRLRDRRRAERNDSNALQPVTERDGFLEVSPQTPLPNSSGNISPLTPRAGGRDRGSKIEENWEAPAKSDLAPQAKTCAEQWTTASYAAEAEAFRSYWLGESGPKARKSCWKRAWENRVVQIHSKVMRDQKFGNAPTAAIPAKAMTADDRAAYLAKLDSAPHLRGVNTDDSRLNGTGPPRSFGQLAAGIASGVPH